ncbi:MAG TPA: DUF255 domain-containing protein, partial [Candidatus Thermoplasmatota archaeon]|nr:DUF255 domain-containing protein [Candidatus Thermoplasmatota archaeon]
MNRLASEPSPYLRGAAHQPVHWRAFGKDAFEEARAADKPVLLDVGAVWCHWCHVMDGESYEDRETARVINERFVAVKVDRDERPDVDVRYQKAVQALTGQGGWPLTAFLLPDGRCFYGGTYFPPDARHGRPAFRDVLEAVARFYRDEKTNALDQAGRLARAIAPAPVGARPGVADARVLADGERAVRDAFDPVHAGFGGAPKFPHTGGVLFALRRSRAVPDPGAAALRAVALETLRGMARGGIHDRVGGGFHRYATDARWTLPHFEKMLYDNAELLRAYVQGFQATGEASLRAVAEGILAFEHEVLWRPRGGWAASQDADVSMKDDGSYFTWTKGELEAAVGPDLARLATLAWGVGEAEGEVHLTPGRHVLFQAADDDALAAGLKMDAAEIGARLDEARRRLKGARDLRKAPFVDPTVYVGWNAMMASAALE